MHKKRTLLATTLLTTAVGLMGCTATTGGTMSSQLPAYQQTLVSQANQQAMQSMAQLPPNTQIAAVLQTGTRTDVPSGILQPGSIILRRSTVVEKPMAPEELAATMRRIADQAASEKLAAEKPIILASADEKLSAYEKRQQEFVVGELAFREQATQAKLEGMKERQEILLASSKDYARAEALAAQLAAQNTSVQLAKDYTAEKFATAAAENKLYAQQTATELKAIRTAQEGQQKLFQETIANVSKELKSYGDTQLASLANETRTTISQTAAVAQQSTADLTQQTADQLAKLRAEAANRTEQLATRLTNQFAENLNTLATETEAKRLTPEQVTLAANYAADAAVNNATPQFRALALQTLADSQDYIRTVAQESLTDDADPAVQEAIQKAAKNVITKDDEVVFAIREALTPKAASPKLPEGERTVLGDGPRPDTITADVMLNASKLGVAALAGVTPQAGPDHLASLNPVGERSFGSPRNRQDWIDLRKYRVVVHEDAATLEQLMSRLMQEAVPYTGPWQVKWKLRPENQDLAQETFSLDAETTFEDFVTYLSQYVMNARGVKLSFNLFDTEHILIISD